MQASVTLSAPSRIHFGLFSVGPQAEHEFGGIGLMIDAPRTIITIRTAECFHLFGPEEGACRVALKNWFVGLETFIRSSPLVPDSLTSIEQLPLEVTIKSVTPRHCGLGSGTQLALCLTAAVTKFLTLPMPSPEELSVAAGRGKRSAIGSYGFFSGGFLVDRGKSSGDSVAPLDFRTDFPEHWPVIVVWDKNAPTVSGVVEASAFGTLPATTPTERQKMIDLVRNEIIPGVMTKDYPRFGEAVYQFGRNSGLFFKSIQGGPYNGEAVADLVTSIREFGLPAVGQTSWGPGVFAIAASHEHALDTIAKLNTRFGNQFEIILTCADNQGVRQLTD